MRTAANLLCRRPEPMDAILVVNAGSSSVKFQVFGVNGDDEPQRLLKGQVDGIGTRPRLRVKGGENKELIDQTYAPDRVNDVPTALRTAGTWLRETQKIDLIAVGHRVVHGGPEYAQPVMISDRVLSDLARYAPLAPLHQPNNLAAIHALRARSPHLPQVACFDTAFHRAHSALADHYAIPEMLYVEGVRRYGFHGLSYEYVASRLEEIAPEIASGRVIVAHLGSGASMCALSGGRSVESTMGFTALDGLPMGTRPGQLDPAANAANTTTISRPESRFPIFVIPTDEEQMIAEHTLAVLSQIKTKKEDKLAVV